MTHNVEVRPERRKIFQSMAKFCLGAILVLMSALCVCLAAAPGSSASVDPTAAPLDQVPDPASALVIRLKQLAEAGGLFDPPAAAKILQTELAASTKEDVSQPPDCSRVGASKSYQVTTVNPPQTWWYHALFSGAGSIKVPAYGMGQEHFTGEPKLYYRIMRRVTCADVYRTQDHTVAQVSFAGLPAFACITRASLKVSLPEVKPVFVSDGPSRLEYKVDTDQFGTVLDFDFESSVCASSASLIQDQESGLRFKRAQYAYQTCRLLVDQEYCSSAPYFTWGDGEEIDKMDQHAAQVCGSLNQNYLREQATGERPKALPDHPRRKYPCDVFQSSQLPDAAQSQASGVR